MQNALLIAAIAVGSLISTCQAAERPEVTIPIEFQQGRPYVSVVANNILLTLLLDLGASDTVVLNRTEADKVGAYATNSNHTVISFDGNQESFSAVHFGTINVGDLTLCEIDGSVLTHEGSSYIGAGLLSNKLIVLDYANKQVRLYKSGDLQALRNECGDQNFPVDVRRGVFQTYFRTEDKTLTALLDTGANYSVLRPSVLNLNVPEYLPGSNPQFRELRNLRFNNAETKQLNTILIEFKAPPVDIVLGTNFFNKRKVCLDAPAHLGAMREYK